MFLSATKFIPRLFSVDAHLHGLAYLSRWCALLLVAIIAFVRLLGGFAGLNEGCQELVTLNLCKSKSRDHLCHEFFVRLLASFHLVIPS